MTHRIIAAAKSQPVASRNDGATDHPRVMPAGSDSDPSNDPSSWSAKAHGRQVKRPVRNLAPEITLAGRVPATHAAPHHRPNVLTHTASTGDTSHPRLS
jgi:hypothetical protein